MRKIIYYVATSLDGFISGPNEDISAFVSDGNGVQKYLDELKNFDTVIMGRNTYEFGYKFGLQAGQPAYPHMRHFIFSDTLSFDQTHELVKICKKDINQIKALKAEAGTDIYLCGGGVFAAWLLENELIDVLKIKLNPIILGEGLRLFANSTKNCKLELLESAAFDHGLQINTFKIIYN